MKPERIRNESGTPQVGAFLYKVRENATWVYIFSISRRSQRLYLNIGFKVQLSGCVKLVFGIIGIGSNTVRLSVYAQGDSADAIRERAAGEFVDDLGGFVRLFSKKVMAGLASYVEDDGCLSAEGMQRAAQVLSYLEALAANLGIADVHAFATASLRDIGNSDEALAYIECNTGVRVELLSCEQEALYGYSSFKHDRKLSKGVLCDIGGGSTELVVFKKGQVQAETSMPFGSLKLFKRHVERMLPTSEECDAIRAYVRGVLDEAGFVDAPTMSTLCGIGGTARAAAKLIFHRGWGDADALRFTDEELTALVESLCVQGSDTRDTLLRVCPDRVHTIIPGTIALQEVARRFRSTDIVISQYGVREGYVYERIIG